MEAIENSRETHALNTLELLSRSTKCNFHEFSSLLDEAIQMLTEERLKGNIETQEIKGGLVRLGEAGEAIIVSDLHGDLNSLSTVLKDCAFVERAEAGEDIYLINLGDYGDRGDSSVEVYYVFLKLKTSFPKRVVLLRGNHEGPSSLLASPYDLPGQLMSRFAGRWGEVHGKIRRLMDALHHAVMVGNNYLLLHGGPPVNVKSIRDIAYAHETHPSTRHLEEILWSDPVEGAGYHPSPRGAGVLFGRDVTNHALRLFGVKTLIRGHEPCEDGVKVNHDGKVLTIFSRKGSPYFNPSGAYLELDLSEAKDAYELAGRAKRF